MSSYLEEAADELRKLSKVVSASEQRNGPMTYNREERRRIADGFAQLAAIESGLLPSTMLTPLIEALKGGGVR